MNTKYETAQSGCLRKKRQSVFIINISKQLKIWLDYDANIIT